MVGANGLRHRGKPVRLEELCELRLDARHSAGPLVHKKGVNLSRRSSETREREGERAKIRNRGGGVASVHQFVALIIWLSTTPAFPSIKKITVFPHQELRPLPSALSCSRRVFSAKNKSACQSDIPLSSRVSNQRTTNLSSTTHKSSTFSQAGGNMCTAVPGQGKLQREFCRTPVAPSQLRPPRSAGPDTEHHQHHDRRGQVESTKDVSARAGRWGLRVRRTNG